MKSAYYYKPGDIRVEKKDLYKIDSNEILIKVKACTLCGTDLRTYKFGHFKIPQGVKRVLGHEISGIIVEVGSDVSNYETGMRVSIIPNVGCGKCHECIDGQYNLCKSYEAFGLSIDGGFQEYLRIPAFAVAAGSVVKIPEKMSYEEAALIEPLSCCYNSFNKLNTRPGDTVLIIGAGPMGNMHILLNRLGGATKVIVADIFQERLDKSMEFGADIIINTSKENLMEAVKNYTSGRGADVIIVACADPTMQEYALDLAAVQGRINFFGGLPKNKKIENFDSNLIHYKELVTLGTTGSSVSDYYKTLDIAFSGRMDLKELISARFTIDRINEAFEYAMSGKGLKVLVENE